MSKLSNMRREMQDAFRDALHAAFAAKFSVEITTEFNIFSMETISKRADGQDFTIDEHAYIQGWSDGYGKAINLVVFRDYEDDCQREMKRQAKESA